MTRSEAIALLNRQKKLPVPPEARESFVGVLNRYLEHRLSLVGHPASVEGTPEVLKACACCRYRTLREPSYEVCCVCFWEDDGTIDLDVLGDCNGLTLREARQNFELFGAVRRDLLVHVLRDGRERFVREAG